jgi:folate-dependent phosphoribosylglycinamide formyltransferase PurN
VPSFVILTTADLPEAYYLAAFLQARAQPFAMVNVAARDLKSQLAVLARLRRNRGTLYLADVLLARAAELVRAVTDRPRHRVRSTAFPEVDAQLIRHVRRSRPFLDCRDPHTREALDFVREFQADYLLLAGSPILRPSVFGLAREATLNRHLGLVPEFRGSDCALWALAQDRPQSVGYSIHVVGERVDGGDVLVRRSVAVGAERSLESYLRRLQRQASEAFVEVIDALVHRESLPRAPQPGVGRYYPPAGWSVRRRAVRTFARLTARLPAPDAPMRPQAS